MSYQEFIDEKIYNDLVQITHYLSNHPWSKRMTIADGDCVNHVIEELIEVQNKLYMARQEIRSKQHKG